MSHQKDKINPAKQEKKIEEINNLFKNLKDKDKLTSSVNAKPQTVDEVANKWEMNKKIMDLFAKKIEKDTVLKSKYAVILIKLLVLQLALLNVWFVLKGMGKISFADTTFNIFITGGLAEIFILIRIIVKYLFSDNLSDLLKVIIRLNNMGNNKKNNKNKKN